MAIDTIEAIPYRLPTRRPIKFSNGSVSCAEHVLIRVRSSDGIWGIGEATPRTMTYGDTARSVVDAVDSLIAPLLIGHDERQIESIHHTLRNLVRNTTAVAALDVALWDLKARRAQIPLAQLLGGFSTSVQAAHLIGLDTPDAMAIEAHEIHSDTGVAAFKVKVGVDVHSDVERTAAVHGALGRDAIIYLDANHGWNAMQTLQVVRELADRGIRPAWIEEPTPAADRNERSWLTARLDIPVVGDESVTTLSEVTSELVSGRCQWIAIKPGRTGIRASVRIVGLATGLGASVVVGSQVEGILGSVANLHLAAAFERTGYHPAEVTSFLNYEHDIIADPPQIKAGRMELPAGDGLGVDVDEACLSRLRIDK